MEIQPFSPPKFFPATALPAGKEGTMNARFTVRKDILVVDKETGLMWQRGASSDRLMWPEGFAYIERLNGEKWGGFDDWRYPTQEELATLLTEEENRETGLYIDPVFGDQRCCWSSTEAEHHRAVYADFYYGDLYVVEQKYANFFVRAVRNA
jgi:serine/threonine-protein kinase